MHHKGRDRPLWDGALFLPRLVILPLMFIPRKVSRPNDVTRRLAATRPEFVQQSVLLQEDIKGKGKPTDTSSAASEELAALVHLALSKHSVWINPDLTSSDDGCTCGAQTGSAHFSRTDRNSLDVPLVPLIRESECFTDIKTTSPEADVVRAIQNHLSDVLEARILVSSPQNSAWRSSGSRSDTAGGYEIRRKDWESVRSITAPLRKQDWDARTVYLVSVKLFTASSPLPMNLFMTEVLTASVS